MAKNDLFLLDGIIEDRIATLYPTKTKEEVFKYLAYEQVLKGHTISRNDIAEGSVDEENDGGIDAVYTFVDGELVTGVNMAHLPRSNASMEVYFFTCRYSRFFSQQPINSIFSTLQEFLDFSVNENDLAGDYGTDLLRKRRSMIAAYKKVGSILDRFSIKVVFAGTGDTKEELTDNVVVRGKQLESMCRNYFSPCEASFEFWGAEELLAAYRKKSKFTLKLTTKEFMSRGKQWVVLATLKDYCAFITDESGKIRRQIFEGDIRDYMIENSVSSSITDTLNNYNHEEDFWWLNNGITVLCAGVISSGKELEIEDVQIVNGLHTSACIYKYFREKKNIDDDREVLIKIISCDSEEVAEDITRFTNNQTVGFNRKLEIAR